MSASLSVGLTTFHSDAGWFAQTCAGLRAAVACARGAELLSDVSLHLIDNTEPDATDLSDQRRLFERERMAFVAADIALVEHSGHGNIGYGAAHNKAIRVSQADFHLILNPDLVLDPDALIIALQHMQGNSRTAMVGAMGRDAQGHYSPLCKRLPSVAVLALRGFPSPPSSFFKTLMNAYEYRPIPSGASFRTGMVSGACMFARRAALQAVGGFDERYFLHFEDIDLSRAMAAQGAVECLTAMKAMHFGGGATRKSGHRMPLVTSGRRYFNKHGWRFLRLPEA